jgi:hypothetical protein
MSISRMVGGLVMAAALIVASQASADLCKNPLVKVINDKANAIKLSKIQYYDDCNNVWREEKVSEREIASGHSTTYDDSLEYVERCPIRSFKLYRAVRQSTGAAYGPYQWGAELTPDQGKTQQCMTGVVYTIHAFD